MKIISIDLGFAILGWAVIEYVDNVITPIDFGVITTEKNENFVSRLKIIYTEIGELISLYKPEEMVTEDIFYFKNQKTVINVSQIKGVIVLAGELCGLRIYSYTPLQVKSAVTGYGRATKQQVQKMVKSLFRLEYIPKPDDVADALALGYCHINNLSYRK